MLAGWDRTDTTYWLADCLDRRTSLPTGSALASFSICDGRYRAHLGF
jgi:hypothetical protein